jgi:hypothetical protein
VLAICSVPVREAVAKANVAAIKKVTLTKVKTRKVLVAATKKAMLIKMQKARVAVIRMQKVLVAATKKAMLIKTQKARVVVTRMQKVLVAATKKAMLTKMLKAHVVVTRTQKVLVAATKRAMLKIKALKASAAKVSAADLFKIPTISLSQKAHGKPWAFFCLLQALSFRNAKFRSRRVTLVAAMLAIQP